MSSSSLKPLSLIEWDSLIDDYQSGRLDRWVSLNYTGLSLIDLTLSSLLRKDLPIPLKISLIVFLEEQFHILMDTHQPEYPIALTRLLDSLRAVVQAPIDGVLVTLLVKEQFLVCVSSVFVENVVDFEGRVEGHFVKQLEGLIELLLSVINRPNHGVDRQTRAVACECLRELERASPGLLGEIAGSLWALAQSERTHAAQAYVLLLAQVLSWYCFVS